MRLMPVFTAQSPSFRQSVQDANARTIARHQQAGVRAPPPVLLNEDDPAVLRQYITGMQDRQRDAFPFGDNLIAQLFIIQSELSDQQRERLTSAMSLRNISLENYSYEMLKTHNHELFITTRTSSQDPPIRPQGGNQSNTFFIIEQGEYEGEEGFWVEDEEGLEGFMSNNDEETFWVLEENDAFIARKVSGRNFRFKKRKGKGKSGNKKGSHQRGGFKPFRKSGSGGKASMANENYDPYDQGHIGEKAKERRERKENQIPIYKGYPPYENGKGKGGHDKGKSKTFAAIAEKTEEQPAIQQTAPSTQPTYAGWTDKDWDQSWTWNEQGWHSSYETSSGQALMAFHDAYEHHEKEAIHEKLIQSDTVSEHNLSVATNRSLLATKLILSTIRPMRSWTMDVPDPWAAGTQSSVFLRPSSP